MPKKRSIRRYIVPIIIIVISISFFVSMIKSKPQPVQKIAPERAWSVKSLIVNKGKNKPVIQLYGRVISTMDIQLTASIEADVEKRFVKLGDSVTKGQLLLTLDRTTLEQFRLQRVSELSEIEMQIKTEKQQFETDNTLLGYEESLLKIANNALKRAKTLEKRSMASNSQIDDANRTSIQQKITIAKLSASIANHPARLAQLTAKQQQAKSRLILAKNDLRETRILSPINGVITQISVDNAEHIRIGSALFSISDTQNIEIQSLIPQNQYGQLLNSLNNQDVVTATINTGNMNLPATLIRLPANIEKGQAGSFAFFRLSAINNTTKKSPLLIGQTVTVYAELSPQANSIALPYDAIYGTDSLFVIEKERLRRIKIKWLGETYLNKKKMILIQSQDLKNNDEVLVSKFANAIQGLKVTTHSPVTASAAEPSKGASIEK